MRTQDEDPLMARPASEARGRLVLVGNFELEPLREPLSFWIRALHFPLKIELWPCHPLCPCLQHAGRYLLEGIIAVFIEPCRWDFNGPAACNHVGRFFDARRRTAITVKAELVVVMGPDAVRPQPDSVANPSTTTTNHASFLTQHIYQDPTQEEDRIQEFATVLPSAEPGATP